MAQKKLSSSFTGSSTRSMSSFEKELEARTKKLDTFTDDFSPPGTAEKVPGSRFNSPGPYPKEHDDLKKQMAAAGNADEQPGLDLLDEIEHRIEAPVKNPYDQFPGEYQDKKVVNDIGALDPAHTDPSTMQGEKEPEDFLGKLEARLKKHLSAQKNSDEHGKKQ